MSFARALAAVRKPPPPRHRCAAGGCGRSCLMARSWAMSRAAGQCHSTAAPRPFRACSRARGSGLRAATAERRGRRQSSPNSAWAAAAAIQRGPAGHFAGRCGPRLRDATTAPAAAPPSIRQSARPAFDDVDTCRPARPRRQSSPARRSPQLACSSHERALARSADFRAAPLLFAPSSGSSTHASNTATSISMISLARMRARARCRLAHQQRDAASSSARAVLYLRAKPLRQQRRDAEYRSGSRAAGDDCPALFSSFTSYDTQAGIAGRRQTLGISGRIRRRAAARHQLGAALPHKGAAIDEHGMRNAKKIGAAIYY